MRPVSVRDAGTYAGFDGLLIWLDAPLCLDWTAVWSRRSSWNHSRELQRKDTRYSVNNA
jgi:hypothetical protein